MCLTWHSTQACNSNYLGGRDRRIMSLRPVQAKGSVRPCHNRVHVVSVWLTSVQTVFKPKCWKNFFKEWYFHHWSEWHTPIIPALGRLRQEDCEFSIYLCSVIKARKYNWPTQSIALHRKY
jgi:hypothetical protein